MASFPSFEILLEASLRSDVTSFSEHVLNVTYAKLKAAIYPKPKYRYFFLTKRNGQLRLISEPYMQIKDFQVKILTFLEKRSDAFRPAVHGFIVDRSILTNAKEHCSPKTNHILNLDIEDFFPSISFYRVRGVLQKRPFNFSHSVATVIAHICTNNGSLPQGAPTSPFLSNLVCRSLDKDLTELARRNRARYTRYADDITFSFSTKIASNLPRAICLVSEDGAVSLGAELRELVTDKHNFNINNLKTRLSDRGGRMEVTGLTVNKKPNVRRIFVDRVRGALHAWEKYGYEAANKNWYRRVIQASTGQYEKKPWKRQTRNEKPPQLKNVLWGKLLFLRMVRGADDLLYAHLAERYNLAVEKERLAGDFAAPLLPVEPVVRDEKGARDAVFVLEWSADYRTSPTDTEMIGSQGTAFAYRKLNFLITCDHALEAEVNIHNIAIPTNVEAPEIENLTLQLVRPHTKESWPAKVLYRNRQFDFAILCFDTDPPQHRYYSVMDTPIEQHTKGFLIGFPAYKQWNLPDFNLLSVLNRTQPQRCMNSFTVSGTIRQGNSGGPFVDTQYRVAGMAQRGTYAGSGHDECLCFEIIDDLISNWLAS